MATQWMATDATGFLFQVTIHSYYTFMAHYCINTCVDQYNYIASGY